LDLRGVVLVGHSTGGGEVTRYLGRHGTGEPRMSSNSVPLQPPMTRGEAGTLLGQTMGLVAVTPDLFAVGAYLGRNLAYQWSWLGFITAFGCLIGMNVAVQRSEGLAFQRLRRNQDIRTAPLLAASIFLDILNVFLLLLSLFNGSRD
jgi:pimeloyl-ACP methyl ester carboxylesterase